MWYLDPQYKLLTSTKAALEFMENDEKYNEIDIENLISFTGDETKLDSAVRFLAGLIVALRSPKSSSTLAAAVAIVANYLKYNSAKITSSLNIHNLNHLMCYI